MSGCLGRCFVPVFLGSSSEGALLSEGEEEINWLVENREAGLFYFLTCDEIVGGIGVWQSRRRCWGEAGGHGGARSLLLARISNLEGRSSLREGRTHAHSRCAFWVGSQPVGVICLSSFIVMKIVPICYGTLG